MILDDNVTAVEGDDVMIDCDIDSNPDDNLTVTWYLDDQPLESYTIDSTDVDTLTLVSVSRDEAGHYSCSVGNGVDVGYSNQALIDVYCKIRSCISLFTSQYFRFSECESADHTGHCARV